MNYVDPLTDPDTCPQKVQGVVLLAHSASTTYKYMENEGDPNDKLYCEISAGSIVVDPWRKFKDDNCTVIHYGNTRN